MILPRTIYRCERYLIHQHHTTPHNTAPHNLFWEAVLGEGGEVGGSRVRVSDLDRKPNAAVFLSRCWLMLAVYSIVLACVGCGVVWCVRERGGEGSHVSQICPAWLQDNRMRGDGGGLSPSQPGEWEQPGPGRSCRGYFWSSSTILDSGLELLIIPSQHRNSNNV